MVDTNDKSTVTPFEVDKHWGALPEGELARLIGANDRNMIVKDEPVGHEELGE